MVYTTPEALILSALNARLSALVLSPVLTIAWPNLAFTPPADGSAYLRVDDLRNTTDRPQIANNAPQMHKGIYQVTVNAPLNGGELGPMETGGLIAAHFWAQPRIPVGASHIRITGRPSVVSLKDEANARWTVPVSVNWTIGI